MTKHFFYIWIAGIIALAAALAGCSDDSFGDKDPVMEEPPERIYVRIKMALADNGVSGNSGDEPTTIDGSIRENAVNTVDLLAYYDSGELADIVTLDNDQINDVINNPEGLVIPVNVKIGSKIEIYAAVNMTETMRSKFRLSHTKNDFTVTSGESDYWDVINDFMPGECDGKQENLENDRKNECFIPMTGQFMTNNGGSVFTIDKAHNTIAKALNVKANLSRIFAKVHVLAEAKDYPIASGASVYYVNAIDRTEKAETSGGSSGTSDEYANWIGWIRLTDVHYIPNATNKSTYIFPQTKTSTDNPSLSPSPQDPNMDITKYFLDREISIGFDANLYAPEFSFYDGISLHRENITTGHHLADVEKYDEKKLKNDKDRYRKGMYCLENYFYIPSDKLIDDAFENYPEGIPMVTHVSIAAKLTPRYIVVVSDYKEIMDRFVKGYEDGKASFLKLYDLTTNDFNDDDVEHWKNMRAKYDKQFNGTENLYGNDGIFRIIKTGNEEDARNILKWSLMVNSLYSKDVNDFERGKYTDGTFYVYDALKYDNMTVDANRIDWHQRYLYLSAGAVSAATGKDENIITYSVPHLGGWGYYFTYLDQQGNGGISIPYRNSQVTRNTYYLITVGNFGSPGGTITRPEYLKVNTEVVDWDYKGRGDIYLH